MTHGDDPEDSNADRSIRTDMEHEINRRPVPASVLQLARQLADILKMREENAEDLWRCPSVGTSMTRSSPFTSSSGLLSSACACSPSSSWRTSKAFRG